MAITTDLSTAIGQVRYLIGDDVDGTGVLPSGLNFTDAQVSYELTATGNVIAAAAARLCGNLARRWTLPPQSFSADGLSVNRGDMVAKWTQLQATLEAQAQGGNFGTVTLDRQDAYSTFLETSGSDLDRT